MSNTISLKPYQFLEKLKALNFVDKIYLYGSRARGDFHDRSDIDLAIVCPRAKWEDWLTVLDIIDEADTLLEIDCVRLDQLAGGEFKKHILAERVELYAKK